MRLSEVYTSVQGEGPNTGEPTTFVRFGGCNLRCPGWGTGTLPDGTVVKGCDTVFAVYPEWRGSWETVTPEGLLDRIPEQPRRVCITGGEPLTQRTSDLNTFAEDLLVRGHHIDLFTNGTIFLKPFLWAHRDLATTTVMDYKLPGSGERDAFHWGNLKYLSDKDVIKFVIKDEVDLAVAKETMEQMQEMKPQWGPQFWFGSVWGSDTAELVESINRMNLPVRLNLQTHKYVWAPNARRR